MEALNLNQLAPTTGLTRIRTQDNWLQNEVVLTSDLDRELACLCETLRVSAEVAMMSAFQTLIFRYLNPGEKVRLELAVSSRGDAPVEDRDAGVAWLGVQEPVLLGFDVDGQMSAADLSQAVQAAFAADDAPAWLCGHAAGAGDFRLELTWFAEGDARDVAMTMVCTRDNGGCELKVSGDMESDLCMALPRAGDHMMNLLGEMSRQPFAPVVELSILTPAEAELLDRWSGEKLNPWLANPTCLHQLFEATVRKHGERVALRHDGVELTYRQLNGRANRLARHMRARGVTAGAYVGLWMPRGLDPFIGLLATLKVGAAYVPMDPGYPAERVGHILTDSGAVLLLTSAALAARHPGLPCPTICLDAETELWAGKSDVDLTLDETGVTPEDAAYVIYTSGSTGKPKGVRIPHRSACNLVRAEEEVYGVNEQDRIFQGFSLAFDASVEELWMAFYNGAALVVGTQEQVLSGPDLPRTLADEQITFFSTVPTQLSMMSDDVPSLRILILGGEECPQTLLRRWYAGGRQVFNTYGPTEATVIATWTECRPDEKVTIGRPVPNYAIYILDSEQRQVPVGIKGELCIGGMSLADEYLNRPELTADKFIEPRFATKAGYPQRVYRSGDLARFDEQGNVEFCGRIDCQVKLRGFRIELSEIEARLLAQGEVAAAVVAVQPVAGVDHLVAYVVPADGASTLDADSVRARLREHLPRYMVPTLFELMDDLPALPSGKVDRKRLPAPAPRQSEREVRRPTTASERTIHATWEELFNGQAISVDDDFFDLGGHSLLAAQMISALRDNDAMATLSLQDVYKHRTVTALAAHVDRLTPCDAADAEATAELPAAAPASLWRRLTCGAAQNAALYLIYALFSVSLLTPFLADRLVSGIGGLSWLLASAAGLLLLMPVTMALSVAVKWLVLGRLRPGTYRLWGLTYWRLWLVSRVTDLVPLRVLRGTPLLAVYYRLMGARVGRDVYMATDNLRAFDMVSVGDEASVGMDAHLMGCSVSDGQLRVAPVTIGDRCNVGARSVLGEGAALEDGASLEQQAMLPPGATVPAGQTWGGSPARPVETDHAPADRPARSLANRLGLGLAQLAAVALVLAVPVAAVLPGIYMAYEIYTTWGAAWTVAFTVPASGLYVVLYCLLVAGIKWVLLGKERPGACSVHSLEYVRRWTVDALMQLSLMVVQPLYATVFLPAWLRLMGARIGARAEISTVDHISADLLEVGEESFIADSVSVGPATVRDLVLTVDRTSVGRRSFIGNSAVLPAGSRVGTDCLIGVMSLPPAGASEEQLSHSAWLGSPAMYLPRRQDSGSFDDAQTFAPPARLVLLRGMVELLKITLPFALTSSAFVLAYTVLSTAGAGLEPLTFALLGPAVMLACGLAVAAVTVAAKWIVVGRYGETRRPLWDHFVWRSELINSLCENAAYPMLLRQLIGTPLLPLFFRLLGSKMGRGVYMDTTEITEFDLVDVGDDACLNNGCTVQTHLFEDRVMKMSGLRIGRGCSVGPMAVVLYDSEMKERSHLEGLSLLMKGETLPAGTRWQGAPASAQ